MSVATYSDIQRLLSMYPATPAAWVEPLFAARLSVRAVESFMQTMKRDVESPLRMAEEGILNREIIRMNSTRGSEGVSGNGRPLVRFKGVLSPSERTRVMTLVENFCQVEFKDGGKFTRTSHAVMNAVRRIVGSYLVDRIPAQASVLEVGADLNNWIVGNSWTAEDAVTGRYRAARPAITPRDTVRMDWTSLNSLASRNPSTIDPSVLGKIKVLRRGYNEVFFDGLVQDYKGKSDYILSIDANYDIGFDDMPMVMSATGAKAWFGCMVRAKGLSGRTKINEGALDLMGVRYRVDWKSSRIDFRHPECSAFGYSHNVDQYMRYEEEHGYVWHRGEDTFVYTKGPETNSELLFFSVVKVPRLPYTVESRFTDSPCAGMVEIESIWAIGDQSSGIPHKFAPIKFQVDALNFFKSWEKRRALNHKGDLAATLTIVRSTNVNFWLNGVPVGAKKKIESSLAEATAVALEALVASDRVTTDMSFWKAMGVFEEVWERPGWLMRCLESVIDLRAVRGALIGPLARTWGKIREVMVDAALSSVSQVRVSFRVVPDHVYLGPSADLKFFPSSDALLQTKHVERIPAPSLELSLDSEVLDDNSSTAVESETGSVDGSEQCEVGVDLDWADYLSGSSHPYKAMKEFVELEQYLLKALLSEVRQDAMRIISVGDFSNSTVNASSTNRTKHSMVRFQSGRHVETRGMRCDDFGAVFSEKVDGLVPVRRRKGVVMASLSDGWYYTSNHLKVYNAPDLIGAVQHALDFGAVSDHRGNTNVVLGVPGAGKTYGLMKSISEMVKGGDSDFLVVSATKKSSEDAVLYGVKFGIQESLLRKRVMTIDSYLINKKFPSSVVHVDEFPMVHLGKVDAVISIAGADRVFLHGDARQIPYDPFCSEFEMEYSTLGNSISEDRVKFVPMTHRMAESGCAMWLDQYPEIYPCDCCRGGRKRKGIYEFKFVRNLSELDFDDSARYHTYKQEEKEELHGALPFVGSLDSLRLLKDKGLSTVHEDQGSTHNKVVTVRSSVVYDKHQSARNPSLYNRERYVLTDTTRSVESYVYVSMCDEVDMVRKRIVLANDEERLDLVRKRKGFGNVSIRDML